MIRSINILQRIEPKPLFRTPNHYFARPTIISRTESVFPYRGKTSTQKISHERGNNINNQIETPPSAVVGPYAATACQLA